MRKREIERDRYREREWERERECHIKEDIKHDTSCIT